MTNQPKRSLIPTSSTTSSTTVTNKKGSAITKRIYTGTSSTNNTARQWRYTYSEHTPDPNIPRYQIPDRLISKLYNRCMMPIEKFAKIKGMTTTHTMDGPLYFKDNGSNILGVGHLDSVLESKPSIVVKDNKNTIRCGQLDDRLGAWVLLDLLPYLDCVPFDIMLTDSEEVGRTTANYFETQKKYNWIFEFDRRGTDVVMYEYRDKEMVELLEMFGFEDSWGSFSDISALSLGCKGFNFGTGYYNEHSQACIGYLNETMYMANKFVKFAKDLHEVHLPHESYKYSKYNSDDEEYAEWWEKSTRNINSNVTVGSDGSVSRSDPKVIIVDYCDECWGDIEDEGWRYCPWCGNGDINNH